MRDQIIETALNCLVFAPFGVSFNILFKKKSISRDVCIYFMSSLAIEVFQLFSLMGGFATADLITNTVSYFIGLAFYILIFSRLSLKTESIVLRILNFLMLPVVIFAVISTIADIELIYNVITRQL